MRTLRNGSRNTILNRIFLNHLYELQDIKRISEGLRIFEQGKYRASRLCDCNTDQMKNEVAKYLKRLFTSSDSIHGLDSTSLLRLVFLDDEHYFSYRAQYFFEDYFGIGLTNA